ncbi:MAG: type II toxin-antitoxin system HigA family antitoxin [Gammaproteobacteria bacterium]
MKQIHALAEHWRYIAPYVLAPKNDEELNNQIKSLDELLDIVGENENHPLMGLVDLVSANIEAYENKQFAHQMGNGIDALKFLMRSHGLSQSDLPEVGSQGVVSEILHGKRELNRRQIEALAKRFKVSSSTFLADQHPS